MALSNVASAEWHWLLIFHVFAVNIAFFLSMVINFFGIIFYDIFNDDSMNKKRPSMDIHAIRQQLKTKSIYDTLLRVTYYARVSSESDEQMNSLGNQITYYEDLIKGNRHWTFVPGYIDEGLSGISTKKRENFNRMIEEAAQNKFDLVIDEEQAAMIRELFQLYATDRYSMKQIETIFWEKGYRNLNGNKIAHTTMSNMIANPKYKGYYVGNKVKVVDMFTQKQKFLPPEEWVMFKDETGQIVPAIICE